MASEYTIVNGQVSIRFNLTTANPVQITATLEQSGHSHGTTSSQVNGTSTLVLQGSNVTDGSYEVVITGLADGQQPVVQRFPVALTEENSGGGEGDYPAYAPNTGYQSGDRPGAMPGSSSDLAPTTNGGRQAPAHILPVGHAADGQDALTRTG